MAVAPTASASWSWTGRPAGRVRVLQQHRVPRRAPGLLALPAGGASVAATRPGRWLWRLDAAGRLVQQHELAGEAEPSRLGGHVMLSADGELAYTAETDPRDDSGWIVLRDARSLRRLAALPSGGRDPHQMLLDAQGRKRELSRMDPSLVLFEAQGGPLRPRARWQLDGPRLSLRHMAWSAADPASGVIGIALQAGHDDAAARRDAPVQALFDGHGLRLPTRDAQAAGYAGDIAAAPGAGFALSGQKTDLGLWWHGAEPAVLRRLAEIGQPCALAAFDGGRGVLLAGRRGVARWHVREAPRMLGWPPAMAPDNHWVLLG